ncbi:hypothetical protein PILCRDRAFT_813331 [Piloderma croceum F 1598]|uniref:Uncharacterized protein n=1 Tax=Piloderma croceum (strain F 1598) TaxID=765440 RepID=A0A0C3GFH3_PILCF|nr:hypothetical protein PILCRDRAFT_813331 [Piloderma croceum F 1598]
MAIWPRTLTAITKHAVKYDTYSIKQVAEIGQAFPLSDLPGDSTRHVLSQLAAESKDGVRLGRQYDQHKIFRLNSFF